MLSEPTRPLMVEPVCEQQEHEDRGQGGEVVPLFRGRRRMGESPLHAWNRERLDMVGLRAELGVYLGRRSSVSRSWVNRRMAAGMPHVKLGVHKQSAVVFDWPEVLAWLDAQERRA